jgi:hypothetical protein
MNTSRDESKPEWWADNEAIKRELGLPAYDPPRFADGVPTHEVVDGLEAEHGCRIRFLARNTRYPEDWTVAVDGQDVFSIGRHRDDNGNTVYELDAEAFVAAIEDAL